MVKRGGGALNSLDDLNVELEVLRSLLRVAYELHFIKASSLGYIIKQIDEVGKMRGGWAKHYSRLSGGQNRQASSNKDN